MSLVRSAKIWVDGTFWGHCLHLSVLKGCRFTEQTLCWEPTVGRRPPPSVCYDVLSTLRQHAGVSPRPKGFWIDPQEMEYSEWRSCCRWLWLWLLLLLLFLSEDPICKHSHMHILRPCKTVRLESTMHTCAYRYIQYKSMHIYLCITYIYIYTCTHTYAKRCTDTSYHIVC